MLNKILSFGAIAGLIVGAALFGITVALHDQPPSGYGVLVGYLIMLVALSLVFVAIKRHRDVDLGGVIRFWPAFATGLGVSFIASVFYVVAWEAALTVSGADFIGSYTNTLIEQQKATGISGPALAKFIADMDQFKADYAKPAYRLTMTFTEIFPVGLVMSLISAALLRNPRVLPARRV